MKNSVIITVDSACDLPESLLDEYQIRSVPLTIFEEEKAYLDGVNFHPDDIYRCYHSKKILPRTAGINPNDMNNFFSQFVSDGYEVVHIDISSDLSSTFQNACTAAAELKGVHVVDSRQLSVGEALVAIEGCRLRDKRLDAAEIAAHLRSFTEKIDSSFVLGTLEFMRKGGRCSGITALGSNLLGIRPCLEVKNGCRALALSIAAISITYTASTL